MFDWMTTYMAPSFDFDSIGRVVWYEIMPSDIGIVLLDDTDAESDFVIVLFSRINKILKIHFSMLLPLSIN